MRKYTYVFHLIISLLFVSCKKETITFKEGNHTKLTVNFENFPDFSFAGYEKNEKPIPLVPVKITLTPNGENDRQQIQDAINQVSNMPLVNGFKGAILLKSGTYHVDNTLYIRSSGIVIRGEGQGKDGTVLLATSEGQGWVKGESEELAFSNASNVVNFALIHFVGDGAEIDKGVRTKISKKTVNIADKSIEVESAGGFNVGDTVVITKTTNSSWIDLIGMEAYGWNAPAYQLQHRRAITKIEGNKLFLDIPMVDIISEEFGGGTVRVVSYPKRLNHSAVENVRLESIYKSVTDERHTWTGIRMDDVTNCWVRNVTVQYFAYAAVTMNGKSDFNTIQDCAMLDPRSIVLSPRRYYFYIGGGMGNFFQRCYSEEGRHDFATGSRVGGPNVFLDCLAINSSNDTGPHHRWATGTLYDNISSARIKAYNRGEAGSGHGWTGAQILFWNSHATKVFTVDNAPGSTNWCIGCTGVNLDGNGYWASSGVRVSPRSLFITQLERRLGQSAVNNIIVPEQESTTDIWDSLRQWGGGSNPLKPFN